jgi:hypothetical protein
MIDLEVEVKRLKEEAEALSEDYLIFAKSAGTVATVKAISEGKVKPTKCVFVGSPWGDFANKEGEFNTALSKFSVPTLFIQQTEDMFFKYAELEKTLKENSLSDYELIEIPGNNHAYDNYDEIKKWMKEFI